MWLLTGLLTGTATFALLAWVYLLLGHGRFWSTSVGLPPDPGPPSGAPTEPAAEPAVVAIVPARDEAAQLPETLPSLLRQEYPGGFRVILVDDGSTDGTVEVARRCARRVNHAGCPDDADDVDGWGAGDVRACTGGTMDAQREAYERVDAADLAVLRAGGPPVGWAGKVAAMELGLREASDATYVLFTDADIAYEPGTVAALVRAAECDHRDLVSQMALLRVRTGWERAVVPAFVYFFAQLYPFRRVNDPGFRTAAAAGGCMLVRREALQAAGGLTPIRAALIDDVALGRLLKRHSGGRTWLGFSGTREGGGTDAGRPTVVSRRGYPRLVDLWDMVARSAYTQLRHSPWLVLATVVGLVWLYALPPVLVVAGGITVAVGLPFTPLPLLGCAAWLIMSATYIPMLRLYGLSPLRAPLLPGVALLYAAMTVDSARRHRAGRGGWWKGRAAPLGQVRGRRSPG